MGQEWERVQHKSETKHFQLFCWEFSIASFTVRSTEAGEREGETEGGREEGRRETAEVVSSYTALVFPGGPRGAATVSSLYCCVVVTCRFISGDSQPGRLIGLSYIIGHFTYILSALLLSHIVEGQHLSVRAIDPRMLEIKTCHVQHRKKKVVDTGSNWRQEFMKSTFWFMWVMFRVTIARKSSYFWKDSLFTGMSRYLRKNWHSNRGHYLIQILPFSYIALQKKKTNSLIVAGLVTVSSYLKDTDIR